MLYVPRTNEGRPLTMLREVETSMSKLTDVKIKLVEKTGNSLADILVKSDPWGNIECQRLSCTTCKHDTITKAKGKCRERSIVYQDICIPYNKVGESALYVGKSARSIYERGEDHARDSRTTSRLSHIREHAL